MAKIPSTVYEVRAKGHVYRYAWRGKGAPRLHAEPGTPAFMAELQAALAARHSTNEGTIAALVAAYRSSDDWTKLAPATRKAWSRWLDVIAVKFGPFKVADFDRPEMRPFIRKWRDEWRSKPRTADMAMQVLSRIMTAGMSAGLLNANPCTTIPRLYEFDRSAVIWTDEDIAALAAVASPEVMWAARLAVATGLRQGDLLRLSWSHVGPLAVEVRTRKSGGKVSALIPMHAELRALLAEIPKRSPVILTSSHGTPWQTGFTSSWRKTVARAKGLGGKHFHDLRGTFATKMFVAGFSMREIAGMLGWSENFVEEIIDRYVRRDAILLDRIRRMDEAETARHAKPSAKPGSPD
jgi:integrase